MAQAQVAHPGKRFVYFKASGGKGKASFERYEMADVDAVAAVRDFPDQYSFDAPNAAVVDKVPNDSIVSGKVDEANVDELELANADARVAVDDAQKNVDDAKGKGDAKALGEAQAKLDAAREKAKAAQADLDAAKNGTSKP